MTLKPALRVVPEYNMLYIRRCTAIARSPGCRPRLPLIGAWRRQPSHTSGAVHITRFVAGTLFITRHEIAHRAHRLDGLIFQRNTWDEARMNHEDTICGQVECVRQALQICDVGRGPCIGVSILSSSSPAASSEEAPPSLKASRRARARRAAVVVTSDSIEIHLPGIEKRKRRCTGLY